MSMSLSEPSFWILNSLATGRRHGYGILQDVTQLSDGAVTLKVATLYATLDKLQHAGLIEAAGEEVVDGRARRYYALTRTGAQALNDEAARLAARARVATERLASRPRTAFSSVVFA